MTVCAVSGCHNASDQKNTGANITYHKIPSSNPTIAGQWVEQIRLSRQEPQWNPSKSTKICSTHFEDSDRYVTEGGLWRIRQGAVPSKNMSIFVAQMVDVEDCDGPTESETTSGTVNEAKLKYPTVSLHSICETVFGSTENDLLRKRLERNKLRQQKMTRKIKSLQQEVRRLKRRNASLKFILKRHFQYSFRKVVTKKIKEQIQFRGHDVP